MSDRKRTLPAVDKPRTTNRARGVATRAHADKQTTLALRPRRAAAKAAAAAFSSTVSGTLATAASDLYTTDDAFDASAAKRKFGINKSCKVHLVLFDCLTADRKFDPKKLEKEIERLKPLLIKSEMVQTTGPRTSAATITPSGGN